MSDIFAGDREQNYRERSNNASMADIAYGQSFLCKSCGEKRSSVGRKPVIKGYSKGGYRCASCSELFAAKSADKEKSQLHRCANTSAGIINSKEILS